MKYLIALLTCFLINLQTLTACSCFISNFCENIEKFTDKDSDLIIKGTIIQRDSLTPIFQAIQYKIDQIYFGEIVTPDSPIYMGEEYMNTDTTVWIFSANSSICMPDVLDQQAIMAISYNEHNFLGMASSFGYSFGGCLPNYFPISQDQNVTGWIWNYNIIQETISLEEFEEVITTGCAQLSSVTNENYSDNIKIFPQPTTGELFLVSEDELEEWTVSMHDLTGREVRKINTYHIDISDLEAGVYFLRFVKNRHQFIKRIIKT